MLEITWNAFAAYSIACGMALVATVASCHLAMLWSEYFSGICCERCGHCRWKSRC